MNIHIFTFLKLLIRICIHKFKCTKVFILICEFTFQNMKIFILQNQFSFPYSAIKILKNVNAKFGGIEITKKWHYWRITNDGGGRLKIRKFWAISNRLKPSPTLGFRAKKSVHEERTFSKFWNQEKPLFSAKCKKLAPSSARREAYLGCPAPYFWHLFPWFWK